MKNLLLLLSLALAACIDTPAGLNQHFEDLTSEHEVAYVTCTPATLELATNEVGTCAAFNPDSTRIDFGGFAAVIWTSSIPSAASISTDGVTRAESALSASVAMTAVGTNGSTAFALVATF